MLLCRGITWGTRVKWLSRTIRMTFRIKWTWLFHITAITALIKPSSLQLDHMEVHNTQRIRWLAAMLHLHTVVAQQQPESDHPRLETTITTKSLLPLKSTNQQTITKPQHGELSKWTQPKGKTTKMHKINKTHNTNETAVVDFQLSHSSNLTQSFIHQ